MKVKNLKVNKNALVAIGIWAVLSTTAIGTEYKLGLRPDSKGHETHLVSMTEYNKKGTKEIDKYLHERPKYNEYILLKKPYKEEESIKRKVIGVPTTSCSKEEINYIIENLNNQKQLLKKDYVKSMISRGYGNDDTYSYYEYKSSIPKNNKYEIAYMTVDKEDINDVKYTEYSPIEKVVINGAPYIVYATTAMGIGLAVEKSYKKRKNKVKTK